MGTEPFIAEIGVFAGNFAPQGWADCDGAILAINQNQALFSLLGNAYGGDGHSTFALPDLRERDAQGRPIAFNDSMPQGKFRKCIALVGIYPPRP